MPSVQGLCRASSPLDEPAAHSTLFVRRFFGCYHLVASQLSSWDLVEPASYSGAAIAAAVTLTPFVLRATWRQHIPLCLLMVGMDVLDRYRTQDRLAATAQRRGNAPPAS